MEGAHTRHTHTRCTRPHNTPQNTTSLTSVCSSDSGTVIHTDDPEMNARMALVAKILNLRADQCVQPYRVLSARVSERVCVFVCNASLSVSNWAKTSKTLLHGPIDIEGHKGRDGRFYLVDSARLFPPAASQETYACFALCVACICVCVCV